MMLLAKLMDFSSSSADIDGQNSAMSNLIYLQRFLPSVALKYQITVEALRYWL